MNPEVVERVRLASEIIQRRLATDPDFRREMAIGQARLDRERAQKPVPAEHAR